MEGTEEMRTDAIDRMRTAVKEAKEILEETWEAAGLDKSNMLKTSTEAVAIIAVELYDRLPRQKTKPK